MVNVILRQRGSGWDRYKVPCGGSRIGLRWLRKSESIFGVKIISRGVYGTGGWKGRDGRVGGRDLTVVTSVMVSTWKVKKNLS